MLCSVLRFYAGVGGVLKQRGKETCLRAHSKFMAKLVLNSWLLTSTPVLFPLHRTFLFTHITEFLAWG